MEKRIFGIILTVLGIVGLIMGAMEFVEGNKGNTGIRATIVYAVLGAIFFFAGIGLIRATRDIKRKDEDVI